MTANEIVVVMELESKNSDPKALSIFIHSKVQSQQDHTQNFPFLDNDFFIQHSFLTLDLSLLFLLQHSKVVSIQLSRITSKSIEDSFFPPSLTISLYMNHS